MNSASQNSHNPSSNAPANTSPGGYLDPIRHLHIRLANFGGHVMAEGDIEVTSHAPPNFQSDLQSLVSYAQSRYDLSLSVQDGPSLDQQRVVKLKQLLLGVLKADGLFALTDDASDEELNDFATEFQQRTAAKRKTVKSTTAKKAPAKKAAKATKKSKAKSK